LKGTTYTVTDLGRAMISGKCAVIGKFKGPILRGLAARAPYFHNGSAHTLADVVTFYGQRFNIGFTEQEKKDSAAFLASLRSDFHPLAPEISDFHARLRANMTSRWRRPPVTKTNPEQYTRSGLLPQLSGRRGVLGDGDRRPGWGY
jgi:hypothetical protein